MDVSIAAAIPEGFKFDGNSEYWDVSRIYAQAEYACMESLHNEVAESDSAYVIWLFVADIMLDSQHVQKKHYEAYLKGLSELSMGELTWQRRQFKEWDKKLKGTKGGVEPIDSLRRNGYASLTWEKKVEYYDDEYDDTDYDMISDSFNLKSSDLGYLVRIHVPSIGGENRYIREVWFSALTQCVRYPYFSFENGLTKGDLLHVWYRELYTKEGIQPWEAIVLMPMVMRGYSHDMHNEYILPFANHQSIIPATPEMFSTFSPVQCQCHGGYGNLSVHSNGLGNYIIEFCKNNNIDYSDLLDYDGRIKKVSHINAYINKDKEELRLIMRMAEIKEIFDLDSIEKGGSLYYSGSKENRIESAKTPRRMLRAYLKATGTKL
jgi:hypothetical protein